MAKQNKLYRQVIKAIPYSYIHEYIYPGMKEDNVERNVYSETRLFDSARAISSATLTMLRASRGIGTANIRYSKTPRSPLIFEPAFQWPSRNILESHLCGYNPRRAASWFWFWSKEAFLKLSWPSTIAETSEDSSTLG